MKTTSITVTEAARNFAHCVSRAHYQNQSFVLVKNGKALARLVPEPEKICTGEEFAEALAHVELSTADAMAWSKDLRKAAKSLNTPKDKWR